MLPFFQRFFYSAAHLSWSGISIKRKLSIFLQNSKHPKLARSSYFWVTNLSENNWPHPKLAHESSCSLIDQATIKGVLVVFTWQALIKKAYIKLKLKFLPEKLSKSSKTASENWISNIPSHSATILSKNGLLEALPRKRVFRSRWSAP